MNDPITAEPVLRTRAEVGEGPAWDAAARRLVWVDITASTVHRFDPSSGLDEAVDVGTHVGAAVPADGGGLVLAVRDGIARLTGDDRVVMEARVEADNPGNRMNDAKCDPSGRLWAGTMAYDESPGAAALYRYDGRRASTVLTGLTLANGMGWSPDRATMYHIDSRTQRIDAYVYDDATGEIRDRRTVVDIPAATGMPDGMTVDEDGCLWVGLWGGGAVHRYTPEGELDRIVRLPATQVTSCAFGGERGDVLYVTTAAYRLGQAELAEQPLAGSLFAVDAGVAGPAATPFTGGPR
ncbi:MULTISPECIES: SMP-30/gluconolactonase/LRE family protein [Thermomonosporaceae]|uniref:SMP-30/gluconolactonase/LRE family protein n=1 Tax=Thermomonosporaceae TaxID=2012 RepID=UPI00255B16A8|nr:MULTISPECIES: SMP-30/gluconolactonase/LRE family protein [Thermomonosporaceae]MDL4773001.1 SMP-30/gluconolactonase/LRE family protein [Actinomadura xylanilytica]